MSDCQMVEKIFNLPNKFLDVHALYPDWRSKLLNVLSDGENTMTCRLSGLFTRIARCAEVKVLRVWCALHQIEVVVNSSRQLTASTTAPL